MARLLAIDWDHDQLRIVAVAASRRGVAVEKTFAWPLGQDLGAANGEELGRKLRDALKEVGIPPAPIVACIGRDRVVIKELRYPPVPDADEPALVRFQAAKELSELTDDVVIDYARLSPPGQAGERQALAVALKKQGVTAWQALARGLGVKLVALTTRPQATLGAVLRAQAEGHAPTGETLVILSLGARWAEMSIQHQGRMVFSRSLALSQSLVGEIKRNLHVFAASNSEVPSPTAILLAGKFDADLERRLAESLGCPVQTLNPFSKSEGVAVTPSESGTWAGAIGVAHLWARSESLAVNFAAPKQPRVAVDMTKRRKIVLAVAAAVAVIAAFGGGRLILSDRQRDIASLRDQKAQAEAEYKKLTQERLDVEALKEWEDTTISWLDEFYDLAARFPYQVGFRVKDFVAQPIVKRGGKDAYVAQISFTLIAKANQDKHVNQLLDALNGDKHLKANTTQIKTLSDGTQEYHIKVDLAKQPAARYATVLNAPPKLLSPTAAPPVTTEADEPDPDAATSDEPAEKVKGGGR